MRALARTASGPRDHGDPRVPMLRGAGMHSTQPTGRLGAVLCQLTAAAGLLIASAGVAGAQTIVTLHEPSSRAWSATVRGGSYASKNLRTILETRSSTDPEYARRALLK